MDQWLTLSQEKPPLREPVWGYGCEGSLLAVCRLYEENINCDRFDLDSGKSEFWCVLRAKGDFTEGELLPIGFITHWSEFDGKTQKKPLALPDPNA